MRNYFKATVKLDGDKYRSFTYHFEDTDRDDTQRAWELVARVQGNMSMYAPPRNSGQWDRIPLIGYRTRGEIMGDLKSGLLTDEEIENVAAELAALEQLYSAAGLKLPLSAVAA